MSTISLLLVDANPTFQRTTTRLIRDYYSEELMVIGTSPGYNDALYQAKALKPTIILVGQDHYGFVDIRLISCLREALPEVGIIVIERFDIHINPQPVIEVGADAFIPEAALSSVLLHTVWRVIEDTAKQQPLLSHFQHPSTFIDLLPASE